MISNVISLNNTVTAEMVLNRTLEQVDNIESICIICHRKDGATYMDWSQQKVESLSFKNALLNNLVLNKINQMDNAE